MSLTEPEPTDAEVAAQHTDWERRRAEEEQAFTQWVNPAPAESADYQRGFRDGVQSASLKIIQGILAT